MKTIKDIDNLDEHGQFHGYQEWYDIIDVINITETEECGMAFRGCMQHGFDVGYQEYHYVGNRIVEFYII